MLIIKYTLSEENVRRIGATDADVGHHSDANVLLDREGAGIQGPYVSEGVESLGRKDTMEEFANRKGDQLNNETSHEHRRVLRKH